MEQTFDFSAIRPYEGEEVTAAAARLCQEELFRKAVAYSRAGFAELEVEPFEAINRCTSLTERERRIADMIASGLLNRQIAERLGISVRTVETHRGSIFRKLGIKTPAELSRMLSMADEKEQN